MTDSDEGWYEEIRLEGSYCDTCGFNDDGVGVEYLDSGYFFVIVRVGCHGGESGEYPSAGDAAEMLSRWTHLSPRIQKIIDRIKND